jgi:predicted HTH transcriptional regulator
MNLETNRIEYKEKLNDSLEKEAVAFLNSKGGDIYVGVKDDGTTVGVPNPNDVQLKIKDRLKDNIRPSIMGLFDVFTKNIHGKTVVVVSIASGTEIPYYIKQKGRSEAGCFIRVGSAVQPMTEELINKLQHKSVGRSIIQIESPEQDLTFRQLLIYYSSNNKLLNEKTFEKTLKLKTEKGKYNYLAYLLADENSVPVRFARYDDSSRIELLEANDYGNTCLLTAIQRIKDRFEVENITESRLTGALHRIDKRLVDNKSLREIIINAFAHNDYSYGMTPIFEVFQDRFAIRSYGGLVPELTKEDFFNGVSAYRNPELMRILKDLEMVEGLGFGMRGITRVYDPQIFKFTDTTLYAVIPFDKEVMKSRGNVQGEEAKKSVEKSVKKTVLKTNLKTNLKTGLKIVKILKQNPKISVPQLAESLKLSLSGVKWNLKKLKEQNKIRRVGADKGGHWEVIK